MFDVYNNFIITEGNIVKNSTMCMEYTYYFPFNGHECLWTALCEKNRCPEGETPLSLFSTCLCRWVNGRTAPCPWSTMCGLATSCMVGRQPGKTTTCPSWRWKRLRSSSWKTWTRWVGPAWGIPSPAENRSKRCESVIQDVPNHV